jgi:hypothetical protein
MPSTQAAKSSPPRPPIDGSPLDQIAVQRAVHDSSGREHVGRERVVPADRIDGRGNAHQLRDRRGNQQRVSVVFQKRTAADQRVNHDAPSTTTYPRSTDDRGDVALERDARRSWSLDGAGKCLGWRRRSGWGKRCRRHRLSGRRNRSRWRSRCGSWRRHCGRNIGGAGRRCSRRRSRYHRRLLHRPCRLGTAGNGGERESCNERCDEPQADGRSATPVHHSEIVRYFSASSAFVTSVRFALSSFIAPGSSGRLATTDVPD